MSDIPSGSAMCLQRFTHDDAGREEACAQLWAPIRPQGEVEGSDASEAEVAFKIREKKPSRKKPYVKRGRGKREAKTKIKVRGKVVVTEFSSRKTKKLAAEGAV